MSRLEFVIRYVTLSLIFYDIPISSRFIPRNETEALRVDPTVENLYIVLKLASNLTLESISLAARYVIILIE